MAKKESPFVDLSDPGQKLALIADVQKRQGLHWYEIHKCRDQADEGRTLRQLAYLFSTVYPAVAAGFLDAWGEQMTTDEVHEFCKDRFLKKPIVSRFTGELLGYTCPSTRLLSKSQMAHYIDQIIKLAGEYLGVTVPPPSTVYAEAAA